MVVLKEKINADTKKRIFRFDNEQDMVDYVKSTTKEEDYKFFTYEKSFKWYELLWYSMIIPKYKKV